MGGTDGREKEGERRKRPLGDDEISEGFTALNGKPGKSRGDIGVGG